MEERDDVKGAGGKLSKRPLRFSRVSSTPYSRPTPVAAADENKKGGGGWFSKLLVTPSLKILPSLFPSSSSSKHQDQGQDGNHSLSEIEQEPVHVSMLTSNNQSLELKELGASAKNLQPKVDSRNDDHVGYPSSNLEIAEIERQLQQRKFSIDETNHLIELLRSRTTDLPDNDGHAARSKLEASEVPLGQQDVRKSMKEDFRAQFDSRMTQKTSEHFKFKANDVTSSPVEIAKAYMDSRTSASGYDSRTGRLKIEKNSFYTDNPSSKLFTPVAKSPMCWPGAVVQSDHEYYTPRSVSIPYHPRTPHAGALFSKSTSKLQFNARRPDSAATKRSPTQVFDRTMTTPRTNSVMDNGISSVSCTHQKDIASALKGAGPSSTERTLEDTSSKGGFYKFQPAVDSTPVHPQSSLMARRILEHLDRSVPSPKDKLLELKLARMGVPSKPNTLDKADSSTFDKQKTKCFAGDAEIADTRKASHATLQPQPETSKPGIFGLASGTTAIKPSEMMLRTPNNHFVSFTFPAPATSAPFSEPPPTPSMATTTRRTLEASEGSIPLFGFGSKSGERRDLSFGVDGSASDIDVSTPAFKFGAGNKSRVSFKLVGRDDVCC